MKIKFLLPILVISQLLSGCQSAYWQSRAKDLIDVAHLRLEGPIYGARADISAISVGLSDTGHPYTQTQRFKLGLGGCLHTDTEPMPLFLVGSPLKEDHARSRWGYRNEIPPFGALGFSVGIDFILGLGVGAEVDFVELVDFLLGFAGVDIIDDDIQLDQDKL